jgi:hypothetical protein
MHWILTGIWSGSLNLKAMDRREYIGKFARGGLLGLLAVATGILVSRKQVALKDDCSGGFRCRNCRELNSCQLPEAVNERVNAKG